MCPDKTIRSVSDHRSSTIRVERTTTVKLESGLERDALLGRRCLSVGGLSCVQRIDIGLMVLLVVKLHDLTGNEGLEGIVAVREIGKSVGPWWNFDIYGGDGSRKARRISVSLYVFLETIIINSDVRSRASTVASFKLPSSSFRRADSPKCASTNVLLTILFNKERRVKEILEPTFR